jgi:hypothetical protein
MQKDKQQPPTETLAFSIESFCKAHALSRPFLYQLWKRGEGPAIMKIGRRTLITIEAATEWRKRHSAPANIPAGGAHG